MLVGSNYFFKNIEGFKSKDHDYIELVVNPSDFKNYCQISGKGKCVFQWRKMDADEFVNVTLYYNLPMAIGKFLIPEFNEEIGFTIDHLKQLKPLVDGLDEKHKYEKIIYDSYIENGEFYLTEKQLNEAYNEYKLYRNI